MMIDIPFVEFDQQEQKIQKWLKKRPICTYCGENIVDEYGYRIYDDWFCPKCMDYNFKHYIVDE